MSPFKTIPCFLAFFFYGCLKNDDYLVGIEMWALASGNGLRYELVDRKITITTLSDYSDSPRKIFERSIPEYEWEEFHTQLDIAIPDRVLGTYKNIPGWHDGVLYRFQKSANPTKVYEVANLEIPKLNPFLDMLDKFLPEDLQLNYSQSTETPEETQKRREDSLKFREEILRKRQLVGSGNPDKPDSSH